MAKLNINAIHCKTEGFMKIAVIGTHSTGKTCLTSKMFAYASKNGINAHYIQEVARSCPLPINDGFTTEAATWIMSKQIALEIEARAKKPDFIICDRSCFDPIVYAIKKFNYPRYRYSLLYQYAQSVLKTYDIIINVRPSSYEIKEDGIRSIDPDFQKDIYDLFEQEFKHMEFVFIIVIFSCKFYRVVSFVNRGECECLNHWFLYLIV